SMAMVLVMGLSLCCSTSKQRVFRFIPDEASVLENFQQACGGEFRHTDAWVEFLADGLVDVEASSHLLYRYLRNLSWRILVAQHSRAHCVGFVAGLPAQRCQRADNVRCGRMFLMPRSAEPARSVEAWRRACDSLAIRHLLCAEHFS